MNLIITGITLDGHSIPVPNGLTELLNSSGAWGIKEAKSTSNEYDHRVEKRKEGLVTILTYKGGKPDEQKRPPHSLLHQKDCSTWVHSSD